MRARAAFEHSVHRVSNRASHPVEVLFTVSQNLREYLLVAEVQHPGERIVEMITYRAETAAPGATVVLDRRLIWEQEKPILDAAEWNDRLVILEPENLAVYARRGSGWEVVSTAGLKTTVPVRDPRGRLQLSEWSITAHLPGERCRGTWSTTIEMTCETGDTEFSLSGELVKLTAGRNALASAGWPLFFSYARIADQLKPLFALAEMDGRTHLYDSERRPAGVFEGWGSDFALAEAGCGAGRDILASSPNDRDTTDSITAYEVVDRRLVQISDPVEFPGPVTALWAAPDGAMAVARNLNSGRYAAYSIAVTCLH